VLSLISINNLEPIRIKRVKFKEFSLLINQTKILLLIAFVLFAGSYAKAEDVNLGETHSQTKNQTEIDEPSNFSITDFHFDAGYGRDSNPLALPDRDLNEQPRTIIEQEFIYGKFNFAADYKKTLFVKAHAEKARYVDGRRPDWFNMEGELRLEHYFNLFDTRWDYYFSVENQVNDETFIDRARGQVARFNNRFIADRFDSTQTNFTGGLSYPVGSSILLHFDLQQGEQDYEDFIINDITVVDPDDPDDLGTVVAFSGLDNEHVKLNLGLDLYTTDNSYYFGSLTLTNRDYLDRRANDIDGIQIADSNLSFTYIDARVGYVLEIDDDTLWRATFGYGRREDNEAGYWNSYSTFLSFYTEQVFATYHILSVDFSLYKYEYDPAFELFSKPNWAFMFQQPRFMIQFMKETKDQLEFVGQFSKVPIKNNAITPLLAVYCLKPVFI